MWWQGVYQGCFGHQSIHANAIITRKIAPDSVVYTDCYRSYNVLDVSAFYHERINHSRLFATGKNHINGVENFWNQAKRVLRK